MKRLTRAANLVEATMLVDLLTEAGYSVSLQRQYLSGVVGDIPPDQACLEVWISPNEDWEKANELISAMRKRPQVRWACQCGETLDGGFEQCWQCGRWMP